MTQVKDAQRAGRTVASHPARNGRTLAQRRGELERQMRLAIANDPAMAVTNPKRLSERMKALRTRKGLKQYEVAQKLDEPPRTFQSWENGEVETTRENYEKVAKFYGVTVNWILFGSDEEPPMPSENGHQPAQIGDMEARLNDRLDELEARIIELRALLTQDAVARADDVAHEIAASLEAETKEREGRTAGARRAPSAPKRRAKTKRAKAS